MENISVGRLDHLEVISGIMKELGISTLIDSRIFPDDQEEITTGEAIEGMILNGLGFSDRPISLTSQFFENKPLDVLFREGVRPEYFNRFKLGRSLDKVCAYGCDLLFGELALCVCQQEGVDPQFNSLDTTTFSLSGEYVPDTDEQAIWITRGYSKDHRPDLRSVLKTPSRGESPEQEMNHRNLNKGFTVACEDFIVPGMATVIEHPGKGAFHHPASREHGESGLCSLDHFQVDLMGRLQAGHPGFQFFSRIPAIDPQLLEPFDACGEIGAQQGHQALSVAGICIGNPDADNQSQRIHQHMSLASVDVLATIISFCFTVC